MQGEPRRVCHYQKQRVHSWPEGHSYFYSISTGGGSSGWREWDCLFEQQQSLDENIFLRNLILDLLKQAVYAEHASNLRGLWPPGIEGSIRQLLNVV